MDYGDITNSLKNDYDRIKYFGINKNKKAKMSTSFRVYAFIGQVMFMGLFNAMLLIDWILNSTSLKGFASSGYIISSCFIGHLKLLFLYKKRQHFEVLVRKFDQDSFKFQNEEEATTAFRDFNFFQKTKRALFYLTISAVLASIATPFIMKRHGELPFPVWCPLNISAPPVFYVALVHQSISVTWLALAYFHVDALLCGALTFIGLQCNVLCLRVKNLGQTGPWRDKTISHVVVHHRDIIELLKMTDTVFGNVYFWQLFSSALALCMDLFLVSLADPTSFEFFFFVVYFIAIAILLLVPCWFASEMTRKSENIPIAAYTCHWITASNSFKKELIFFIQQSQKPLKLYAAGYFEISVETFVKIIRSSLSYFAVLTNLNN